MSFFSSLFSREARCPATPIEVLFEARGLSMELPGLDVFLPDTEHMPNEEREHWADAIAALHKAGLPLPPVWQEAQHELMPVVVQSWQAQREAIFWSRPVFEGLSERMMACGQPFPEAWATLWGTDIDSVRERAMENLRERSVGKAFLRLASGVYQSQFEDGMDASRMLLPEIWENLFPGQNLFVAVPAPEVLLVAPQVLLRQMVEHIGKTLGSTQNRLLGVIYQRAGNGILPANLQDPHPIAQTQRELRQSDLLEAYRAQEADLDPAQGDASQVGLMRTQQGRTLSFALWKEGAPVLLPETDLVGFISADQRPLGLYHRQTLPRITRLRGQALDLWGPRRTRYEGFPTIQELERLECFANAEQMAGMFKQNAPRPTSAAVSVH